MTTPEGDQPPAADAAASHAAAIAHDRRIHNLALIEGLIAVFFFALTLPMSRYVVREIHPAVVGVGRAAIAGLCALPILLLTRQRLPRGPEWRGLLAITPGIIYIFPVFVAWAMQFVPSSHGGIVIGLLPLSTAIVAAVLGYERPPWRFWLAAIVGSVTVVSYALAQGGGHITMADLALLGAVCASGVAYAVSGRLSKTLGGWQVISWVSALNLVITIPLLIWLVAKYGIHASLSTWIVFIFMGVVNQYLAFFMWNNAMARVGVNTTSQLQLLQPFITLAIGSIFLWEPITYGTVIATALVVGSVFLARSQARRHTKLNTSQFLN